MTESPKKQRASLVEVLRNRNFFALWLGQVISQIGDSFTLLAIMKEPETLACDAPPLKVRDVSGQVPEV